MNTQPLPQSSETVPTSSAPNHVVDPNPLDPEAPIHHLLSVVHNPMVKDMTTEQLNALITKLRANATSPQTLTATIQRTARQRPMTEAQRKRKELLDSL